MKTPKHSKYEIICGTCGTITVINEWAGTKYRLFDSKKYWCIICNKVTIQYYIQDRDYAYQKLLSYDDLNPREEHIKLLFDRKKRKL